MSSTRVIRHFCGCDRVVFNLMTFSMELIFIALRVHRTVLYGQRIKQQDNLHYIGLVARKPD